MKHRSQILALKRLGKLLYNKIPILLLLCIFTVMIIFTAKNIYSKWQIFGRQNLFNSIISSDEAFVRSTALSIVEEEKKSSFFKKVKNKFEDDEMISNEELGILIYEYVNRKWQYFNDPAGIEYLAKPKETIENGYKGDCDDYAICLAALLKAIGLHVRLTSMKDDWSGHLYPSCLVSEKFMGEYETEESKKFFCESKFVNYADQDIQLIEEYDNDYKTYLEWLILDWKDNYSYSIYYLDKDNNVFYSSLKATSTFSFCKIIGLRVIFILCYIIALFSSLSKLDSRSMVAIIKDEIRMLIWGKYSEFLAARYLIIDEYYSSFEAMRLPHVISENLGEKTEFILNLVPGFLTDHIIKNKEEFDVSKIKIMDTIKKYKILKEKYSANCEESIWGEKIVFKTAKETLEIRLFINFLIDTIYYDPVLLYKYNAIEAAFTRKYFLDMKSGKGLDVFKLYLNYALKENRNQCEFICEAEMADEIIRFFEKYPDSETNYEDNNVQI